MKKLSFIICGLLAQLPLSGFASYANQDFIEAGSPGTPADEVHFLVDQTFQSKFKDRHGYDHGYRYNNVTNTWHYDANWLRRCNLGNGWSFLGGLEATRYDFGDNRSKAPNILQSYAGQLGIEHRTNGQVDFSLQTNPGLYFSHRLDIRDFDAPTMGKFYFPVSEEVSLMVGARVSTQSHYPVFPLAGAIWHINPTWDLQACLPAPRLVYNSGGKFKIWGGGELTGSSFRYDNRGKVDYYEIRAGAGMDYQINPLLSAKVETGYALVRNFRMNHYTAETKPAPYLNASISALF